MKIEILGTGCPKCQKLHANAVQAVQESGVQAEIVKVTDIREIMKRGVMLTPALSVNGVVKSMGKVLDAGEIKSFLQKEK
ncbi:MAG: thioredoxin family protein [Candidatus Aureabacteria bacterium]|nr:thioredoxin family protein [Candidatus Auribacterota bacterium]